MHETSSSRRPELSPKSSASNPYLAQWARYISSPRAFYHFTLRSQSPSPPRSSRLTQSFTFALPKPADTQGMGWWTLYGLAGVGLAHHFNPTFRKQTWAIKAFLVTSGARRDRDRGLKGC